MPDISRQTTDLVTTCDGLFAIQRLRRGWRLKHTDRHPLQVQRDVLKLFTHKCSNDISELYPTQFSDNATSTHSLLVNSEFVLYIGEHNFSQCPTSFILGQRKLRRRKTLISNRGRWSPLSLFRQVHLGVGKSENNLGG